MKSLLRLFLLLSSMSAMAFSQTAPTDSVQATKLSDCCFDFLVKNRNPNKAPIDIIVFEVLTPGVTIVTSGGVQHPTNWVVANVAADSVKFAAAPGSVGMRAGQSLSGFVICFGTTVSNFDVRWKTMSSRSQSVISQGILKLKCAVGCDQVSANSLGNCCFNWEIRNRNSALKPTTDFHLQVLTPGVTILSATAPKSWSISGGGTPGSTSVNYEASQSGIIDPGRDLRGFTTCFDVPGSGVVPFRVRWITTLQGRVVCDDTLTLRCTVQKVGCDSVGISLLDDCCYEITIANKNTSKTPISDFHIAILTPGVTVSGTPSGPTGWTAAYTGNDINFIGTPPIAAGSTLGGFKVCFKFSGGLALPFQIAWRTTSGNNQTICSDTVDLQCGQAEACDTLQFQQSAAGPCCFDVTLKNRHTPFGPLDDLHIKILTPGASFITTSVLGPWATTALTPTEASFATAASALASGTDLPGFRFCIDTKQGLTGPVTFYWESTLSGQVICAGTETVDCGVTGDRCDSVRATNLDDCCYDFTVLNRHNPTGIITDFHVEVMTPGVTIRSSVGAPPGWKITNATSQKVDFLEPTGAGIPANGGLNGFKLCFDNIPNTGVVKLLWCTTEANQNICCDSVFIQCAPSPQKSDLISPTLIDESHCCWDYRITNQHTPTGAINDVHIKVLTPGVTVASVNKPIGWVVTNSGTQVDYTTTTNAIGTGSILGGFVVCFDPKTTQGQPFQAVWQTTLDGQIVSTDTMTLSCTTTGVERLGGPMPNDFILYQNYPNPFNPTTVIGFDVPRSAEVELTVHDAAGRTQMYLVHERLEAGHYQTTFDASILPSGSYYYTLRSGNLVLSKTMLLLK